jgi:hypothetical protein
MELLYFIVSIIANFIASALLIYCFDGYEFKWKDGKKVSVRMPRVEDLRDPSDTYQVSNYVREVINPAHHYFLLRDEFTKYESTHKVTAWLILESSSLLLVYNCFKNAFSDFLSTCNPVLKFLLYALILAVCALAYFVIYKIYRAKFAILRIWCTEENLKTSFEHRERTKFDIDEKTEWNNFALKEHYNHVLLYVEHVRSREYISQALYGLGAILYILFFMRFSY